jgi:DNA-binding FrmR family transcriptional regulator
MNKKTTHKEQQVALKRIEGQIRGIQKMIEDERYCVDILTQLHSVVGAILRVEDNILSKHLQMCVSESLKAGSALDKKEKIEEITRLLKRFRK